MRNRSFRNLSSRPQERETREQNENVRGSVRGEGQRGENLRGRRWGTNPTWNEVVKVKFYGKLRENDVLVALNADIYAHRHVREKPVGSARVLLCEVLKGGNASEPVDNPVQCMTVQVWGSSGRPQGLLNLWVPPTGRFLLGRESLSFNVKEVTGEEKVEREVVLGAPGVGGGGEEG